MSKFDLFKDLDGFNKAKPKQYQIYEIKSGIEMIKAKVPIDKIADFEKLVESLTDINVYSMKKLLDTLGGSLQE